MSAPTDTQFTLAPVFDYQPKTRLIYGAGTLGLIGKISHEVGGTNALIVTDKGLRATGQVDHARELIEDRGISVTIFDEVRPNPTTDDVDKGLALAHEIGIDQIIGFGGGSSLDCAKGINFLYTNGGRMEDYWGVGKAKKPMLPLIAIPTTAGTGSEAQSFALIANADTHMKMACGDKKAACKVAILDPKLTVSMPVSVTANTGIDAITHAVESYVTNRRTPISCLFAAESWKLLHSGFAEIFKKSDDVEARGRMQLGAYYAGAAIENSMLGAAHSCANPLSAHFGTTHGIAVGVMLPHVIRFNAPVAGKWYGELAEIAEVCDKDDPEASLKLADYIVQLIDSSGSPTTLKSCHVDEDLIPKLAREAAQQWTAQFNPREITAPDFEELYRCAIE
ncbi:MAG: iron-containing alcohol dehydrogenase [Planctomycetaceae bacterium]|nr:iron-containing alcohol dehydrogenase [Planctomycetaceae bacterium]